MSPLSLPALLTLVAGILGGVGVVEDRGRLAAAGVVVLALSVLLFERGLA